MSTTILPQFAAPDDAFFADVAAIERGSGGQISFAARDLQTGATLEYHAERKCKTASVIKLPILTHVALGVAEGALRWDEMLTLTEAEKVPGAGVLTQLTAGLAISLRDVCMLMTILSDNTGTNMVLERVGISPINARMRSLGLPVTTCFRKGYASDEGTDNPYGWGVTTPMEMRHLLTLLAEGQVGDGVVSADIMSFLAEQHYRDSIPRFLPADWKYAGKTGGLDQVRNDVGIVTTPDGSRYALALFCQELPTVLWTPENPGELALARLAHRILTSRPAP
jgi:beta-lactamase class A